MASNSRGSPVVLAVFAHPDDECMPCGGTLAGLARSGAEVHLICATRGEAGEIADPSLAAREALGDVRQRELVCSCEALGIHPPIFLGYRDSGMRGADTNSHPESLASAPLEEVASRIGQHLARLRPSLLLTFDPTGGYGHPDHVAVHLATMRALGAYQAREDLLVLFPVIPRGAILRSLEDLKLAGVEIPDLGDVDLDEVGTADEDVNLRMDVSDLLDAKMRSLECHATQRNSLGPWMHAPRDVLRKFASTEYFVQAQPAAKGAREATPGEVLGRGAMKADPAPEEEAE